MESVGCQAMLHAWWQVGWSGCDKLQETLRSTNSQQYKLTSGFCVPNNNQDYAVTSN